MNRMHSAGWLILMTFTVSANAVYAENQPSSNSKGLMVTSGGMALYTYDPDGTAGHSQCTGSCAALWPPYTADTNAKANQNFTVIVRPDGASQWAYKGRPLYQYAGDTKPEFANGDGIDGVWHLARP